MIRFYHNTFRRPLILFKDALLLPSNSSSIAYHCYSSSSLVCHPHTFLLPLTTTMRVWTVSLLPVCVLVCPVTDAIACNGEGRRPVVRISVPRREDYLGRSAGHARDAWRSRESRQVQNAAIWWKERNADKLINLHVADVTVVLSVMTILDKQG